MKTKNLLEIFLLIIGILEMIGGIILAGNLTPGAPEPGYTWKTIAYLPAIYACIAGLASGIAFIVLSNILLYTRLSSEYSRESRNYLKKVIEIQEQSLKHQIQNTQIVTTDDSNRSVIQNVPEAPKRQQNRTAPSINDCIALLLRNNYEVTQVGEGNWTIKRQGSGIYYANTVVQLREITEELTESSIEKSGNKRQLNENVALDT